MRLFIIHIYFSRAYFSGHVLFAFGAAYVFYIVKFLSPSPLQAAREVKQQRRDPINIKDRW